MNFIDKIISYFNPQKGFKRLLARNYIKRSYEGASKGRRTKNWFTTSRDANQEIFNDLSILRNRSRDLSRNNPYGKNAIEVITSETIGLGIMPSIIAGSKNKDIIEKIWRDWAESTKCDSDGKNDFYGIQELFLREIAESGECLIRKRIRRANDAENLPIPLQLQLIEADYLDTYKQSYNGNEIKGGIEFNSLGRIVAYWIFKNHPGSSNFYDQESIRVLAENIIHGFKIDRAGQVRGVPWPSAVIIKMRDFDEYEDAHLIRQKIANCFTAFITADQTNDDGEKPIFGEKMEPGQIEQLPPGHQVQFGNPPSIQGGYGEFSNVSLHSIAAGYGITYEAMTGDYSQVNYSSGRMGSIQMFKNIRKWQNRIMITQMCKPCYNWFLEVLNLSTGIDVSDAKVSWTPPKREMLDPSKEVPAYRDSIRNGFTTLPDVQRQHGYDPKEIIKDIADSNKMLDDNGIILDTDPRLMNRSGALQISNSVSNNNDNSNNENQNNEDENI